MSEQAPIKAEVTHLCGHGRRRYVVTHLCDERERAGPTIVTFSLHAWGGSSEPRPRQIVQLFGVEQFARGWRAQRAEPIRLPSVSKKQ